MREKKFKRCPRCDKKTPIFQDRCEGCGLIFSRLSKATNTAAKKALKNKEYNKVILDKVLPRDVKKWPLFFYALFFGFFGVHYAKVGRYRMFTYMIISAAMLYIAVFLPSTWFDMQYLFILMWTLVLAGSMSAIIWIISIFQILFNKFKVPISIDEELVKESLDPELVTDILKQVKTKDEKDNITKDKKNKKEKSVEKEIINKQNVELLKCVSCGSNKVKVVENDLCKCEHCQSTMLLHKENQEIVLIIKDERNKKEPVSNKKKKKEKIKVVCASCGAFVKVYKDETICPKCDEPLNGD